MCNEQQQWFSPEQVFTYLNDGVLVVDNLLSPYEVSDAQTSLAQTLLDDLNVDVSNLDETGHNLTKASSTNGAGGVLDIFYPLWKMKIATNEKLFRMTCQLWKEAYCNGEKEDDVQWHPFGTFDCNRGYMYIDRIGFRLPTEVAERIGEANSNNEEVNNASATTKKKKKKRPRAIQRSLTPHFDLCPETYHSVTNKNKWRPIQCFVSLTDNLLPNTGGFEAAPGFHREFHSWVQRGRRLSCSDDDENVAGKNRAPSKQQPCVGEYTHVHDRSLMKRVQHIPVKAGSVVFWDNRLPHGNSYRNDNIYDPTIHSAAAPLESCGARAVVYCSFLPDISINRTFVERQLIDWKMGRAPRVGDRWMKQDDDEDYDRNQNNERELQLSALGRKLIGLDKW